MRHYQRKPAPTTPPPSPNRLMCHVCGEIIDNPSQKEGDDCPREIFDRTTFRLTVVDQCAGQLWRVRYEVIDLKSNTITKAADDTALDALLVTQYGTSDRKSVQNRCTILVFPREGVIATKMQ